MKKKGLFKMLRIGVIYFLLLVVNGQVRAQEDRSGTMITVQYADALPTDSFKIEVYEDYFEKGSPAPIETAERTVKVYKFRLKELARPFYISLFKDYYSDGYPMPVLDLYLVEPGDNVKVIIKKGLDSHHDQSVFPAYRISFSGKGSAKYECRYRMEKIYSALRFPGAAIYLNGKLSNEQFYDSCTGVFQRLVNQYRRKMSFRAYNILSLDYFSLLQTRRIEEIPAEVYLNGDSSLYKLAIEACLSKLTAHEQNFSDSAKVLSARYPRFVLDKLSIGKYIGGNVKRLKDDQIFPVYASLKENNKGRLRERLLTFFALSLVNSRFEGVLQDALANVRIEDYKNELILFEEQNAIGKAAFNFALPDTTGKLVTLNDFRGKVVFIDFWFNGCSGCAQYYSKVISKTEERFRHNPDVAFITINVDADKGKWLKGIHSGRYTSSSVANLYTGGLGVSHPIVGNYRITYYPFSLLIDKHGRILVNSEAELRGAGSEGLIDLIDKALLKDSVRN